MKQQKIINAAFVVLIFAGIFTWYAIDSRPTTRWYIPRAAQGETT